MHLTFSPLEPDHLAETAQHSLSLTLAGPSQWPENPHPWAIWLVSSISHSPQRLPQASSALLSHPVLSFPLIFLPRSENGRPHGAPLSFSSDP